MEMIKAMPKNIEKGSKWVLLPMSWVEKWQNYIYFDLIMGKSDIKPEDDQMPDDIDWDELTKPINKKTNLLDTHKDFKWQNLELLDNLVENKDFFVVTPEILEFVEKNYGYRSMPIYRFGIEQPDKETVVELYLKKF